MIVSIDLGDQRFAVDLYGNASLTQAEALAQTGISMRDVEI